MHVPCRGAQGVVTLSDSFPGDSVPDEELEGSQAFFHAPSHEKTYVGVSNDEGRRSE